MEDAIGMTRIAGRGAINSYAGSLTEDFAYFSPDRKQFVIILKRGNLEKNTNDYSLLLFKSEEAFSKPKPRLLASLSSSSNRAAITDLVWLADNDTLLFLGEGPGESSQLFSVSASSGRLRKLTNCSTNVVTFSSDSQGRKIVYAVEKPAIHLASGKGMHDGVVAGEEELSALIQGEWADRNRNLFILNTATGESRPLPLGTELRGELYGDYLHFSLSPDGTALVVNTNLLEVPTAWHAYRERMLAKILDRKLPSGALLWVSRYGVIDTETGKSRVLLDAPISYYGSEVVWTDDKHSLLVTGVFLPLGDAKGDPIHLTTTAVVSIHLEDLKYRKVSDEDLRFVRQDRQAGVLILETRERASSRKHPEARYFRLEANQWVPTDAISLKSSPFTVVARQDLTTPPRIDAFDPRSGRESLLLDPNPQFDDIEFGKVEEIRFVGAARQEVRAGLYYPPHFRTGTKYPLVIQTHGFDAKSFWIEGSFTTAFAAQALASQGFLVLQIPDNHAWDETPDEAPNMSETFERAVEYVDGLGILDRDSIGIIGFSRTGLYVHYLLTHSKIRLRAAVVADGSDGGYSQYLQFLNGHPFTAADSELINGGMPFGGGLLNWLRRSPEFHLDTVSTPLMIQVTSPHNLPTMWAPYVGLKRLGKPVELLYFPTGAHILEKPWDRLASQQGSVDWLRFWMKGEEDTDPSKGEKYQRWRALRRLQGNGAVAAANGGVPAEK